jgi:hypothetical protein
MIVLGRKDIVKLANNIKNRNESIDPFLGDDEDQILVVKKDLKIRHIPTGIIYTVVKVIMPEDSSDPKILCKRPGKRLLIPSQKFNEYERQ